MKQSKEKMELSKGITKEQLIFLGGIYFDSIQEGFELYEHSMLEGTEEELLTEIKRLRDSNGMEYSYADFYYGSLNQEERDRVKSGLSASSLSVLEKYEVLQDMVFLSLEDELLHLTAELNAKEILFSTYYFCKHPCTVWGNYNRKYPVFTRRGSGNNR
ncbi:hypothetical protein [Konateibacter massiliensis]|uniref:hypothetical protein n=1 Tax=Konateibacter massiliensis TaxID=2002841 RepID=UPI001179D530|nr:hypothetical protein [Konateibacter massiliensis]